MSERYPAIPDPSAEPEALLRTVRALKESVEMLTGMRGTAFSTALGRTTFDSTVAELEAAIEAAADAAAAEAIAAAQAYADAGDRWVTIADTALTAVASVDVEWTEGAYRALHIYLTGVLPASGPTTANLGARLKVAGTYLAGATDYARLLHNVDNATAGVTNNAGSLGVFQVTFNNAANDEISVAAVLDPGGTGLEPSVLFNSKYSAPAGRGQAYGNFTTGTEGAVSGIRFLWNSGVNFTAQGRITVVGLKA